MKGWKETQFQVSFVLAVCALERQNQHEANGKLSSYRSGRSAFSGFHPTIFIRRFTTHLFDFVRTAPKNEV